MERLTIPDVRLDGNTVKRSIIDAQKIKECAMELYWRLKDIEDIIADEESEDYDLSRLRELMQADREGRCVVLPVKPGNTVWSANVFGVSSHVIRRIELNQNGDFACSMLVFPFEDFGNKVFLTREAAEAALKEREKDERKKV